MKQLLDLVFYDTTTSTTHNGSYFKEILTQDSRGLYRGRSGIGPILRALTGQDLQSGDQDLFVASAR